MKLGIIGLGKMGAAILYRMMKAGHTVVAFDLDEQARQEAHNAGASVVDSLRVLTQQTKIIWLMVPAGDPVDTVLHQLMPVMQDGTIVIDGGNSNFQRTQKRYKFLKKKNIKFLDCAVSGGLKGREIGFSLMIGGDKDVFVAIESLFTTLAAPDGYGYMGPTGAGHYVKMIHNGIEYGLLQAYAEGCQVLKQGESFEIDLQKVMRVWSQGSVIRSWITELLQEIFKNDQTLHTISGHIDENLTGRWMVDEAKRQNIQTKLINNALAMRAWSRETDGNYATKVVAMLRNKFGGHAVKEYKKKNIK